MNEKNRKLLEWLGEMDDSYVEKAAGPWESKTEGSFYKTRSGSMVKAACAALLLFSAVLAAAHPQVNAAVRGLFSRIGQMAGQEEEFAPYASPMDLVQTRDGVTLALEEAVLMDDKLYAMVSLESELENAEIGAFNISFPRLKEDIHASYTGEFLSGSSRENGYVIKYSFEEGMLSEDTEITLYLTVWEDWEAAEKSEQIPFQFTFSAADGSLRGDTAQYALDQGIEIRPGAVLELESLLVNHVFSRIQTKCGEAGGLLYHGVQYYLVGEDSLGNEVCYAYEAENGPYGHFTTRKAADSLTPSPECEWIELQLYEWDGAAGTGDETPDVDALTPVGEEFRIELN